MSLLSCQKLLQQLWFLNPNKDVLEDLIINWDLRNHSALEHRLKNVMLSLSKNRADRLAQQRPRTPSLALIDT